MNTKPNVTHENPEADSGIHPTAEHAPRQARAESETLSGELRDLLSLGLWTCPDDGHTHERVVLRFAAGVLRAVAIATAHSGEDGTETNNNLADSHEFSNSTAFGPADTAVVCAGLASMLTNWGDLSRSVDWVFPQAEVQS